MTMDLSGLLSLIQETPSLKRLRRLPEGRAPLRIGVAEAAKAVAVAALARARSSPVLVIASRPDRAEALAEELGAWLGDPEAASLFPPRDSVPYERLSPAPEGVRDRLRILS